jgi:hypothetical protein
MIKRKEPKRRTRSKRTERENLPRMSLPLQKQRKRPPAEQLENPKTRGKIFRNQQSKSNKPVPRSSKRAFSISFSVPESTPKKSMN